MSKENIKKEIVDIAISLPYASSEEDANQGVEEIIELLKQL